MRISDWSSDVCSSDLYYQAIDFAIARGLQTVEAGAQGEHKLARGYAPVPTWSAHYIADPRFRAAVDDFLVREREAAEQEREWINEKTPFRREGEFGKTAGRGRVSQYGEVKEGGGAVKKKKKK